MSSTNKSAKKQDPFEYYPTPEWCVHRLLEKVRFVSNEFWVEPSAGDGAILRAIQSFSDNGPYNSPTPNLTYAVEIQQRFEQPLRQLTNHVYIGDFFEFEFHKQKSNPGIPEVVIGNPPYGLAKPMIEHGLKQARNVCFLLRLNFLGSNERAEWLAREKPSVFVLPNRPKFVKGKSDSCEYGWFLFGERATGHLQMLNTTPLAERKKHELFYAGTSY